jgi:hypothetical protein
MPNKWDVDMCLWCEQPRGFDIVPGLPYIVGTKKIHNFQYEAKSMKSSYTPNLMEYISCTQ